MTEPEAHLKRYDLKKQSQFASTQIGVRSFMKGDYENKAAGGDEKNKAKQSQFLYRRPDSSLIIIPMLDARYSMLVGYQETRIKNRDTRL